MQASPSLSPPCHSLRSIPNTGSETASFSPFRLPILKSWVFGVIRRATPFTRPPSGRSARRRCVRRDVIKKCLLLRGGSSESAAG